MSYEEADTLMDRFEKRDARQAKHTFITRMEHRLFRRSRETRTAK